MLGATCLSFSGSLQGLGLGWCGRFLVRFCFLKRGVRDTQQQKIIGLKFSIFVVFCRAEICLTNALPEVNFHEARSMNFVSSLKCVSSAVIQARLFAHLREIYTLILPSGERNWFKMVKLGYVLRQAKEARAAVVGRAQMMGCWGVDSLPSWASQGFPSQVP